MAVGVGVAICSMAYAWNSAETFEVIVSEENDVKSLGGGLISLEKKMKKPPFKAFELLLKGWVACKVAGAVVCVGATETHDRSILFNYI